MVEKTIFIVKPIFLFVIENQKIRQMNISISLLFMLHSTNECLFKTYSINKFHAVITLRENKQKFNVMLFLNCLFFTLFSNTIFDQHGINANNFCFIRYIMFLTGRDYNKIKRNVENSLPRYWKLLHVGISKEIWKDDENTVIGPKYDDEQNM